MTTTGAALGGQQIVMTDLAGKLVKDGIVGGSPASQGLGIIDVASKLKVNFI